MHPQRTLIEAAEYVALKEFNILPQPVGYRHKEHTKSYSDAISELPDDNTMETLSAKNDALREHHPMKFHTMEAAESIADHHEMGIKPNLERILNNHFDDGYIQDLNMYHGDKYRALINSDPKAISSHTNDFQAHVLHHLENTHGLTIDDDDNVKPIGR